MGLILAGGILAAVFLLRFCWDGDSWPKTLVKTGSLGLPALALAVMGWPTIFVAGLAACVLGDFLLSRPGQGPLLAGIGAFALGHLLYIGAMVGQGPLEPTLAIPLALLILLVSTEWWLVPYTGALRWPVRGYVGVIVAMGIVAALTGQVLLIAGALAFVASDLVLSLRLFGLLGGAPSRVAPFAIWGMYVAAQALLAIAFAP
ncbi:lysoplasmalogenase [Lutimaribacter sp. EGI FJ00015]|uniref:Lysoplasmalogenase n=1 Tax=Lutimaribacter degradans TaxID=2945989 RepID=A0ACC5ZTJ2_9RHOB|nr:lysoplasmalogenase family protein [Lutimaribacter sp. EGI FJ00013]MCM2560729.1 lysoplasmalogenase [Lutimaribacter sp. EGI FJ00013]MCO0612325.1 lysoplasmalogenase [Lutimaribacter sp. EGI FJ00015]MCO0634554.1 lysoplasmalogenase [Lutimaribacter sp. EGI FJ00014]